MLFASYNISDATNGAKSHTMHWRARIDGNSGKPIVAVPIGEGNVRIAREETPGRWTVVLVNMAGVSSILRFTFGEHNDRRRYRGWHDGSRFG
jgi:hypothetical protein